MMSIANGDGGQTLSSPLPARVGPREPYLFVVENGSSSLIPLPASGEAVIGRDAAAEVRIESRAASRRHAKLSSVNGELTVEDLGSHNGTLLNGRRLGGPRVVRSGDTIAIGDVILIVHCPDHGAQPTHERIAPALLGQRLEAEVARATEHERPLAVIVVGGVVGDAKWLGILDRELGAIDIASRIDDERLVVVVPEIARERVLALARRLVAAALPVGRAGVAFCPGDGSRASVLLAAAGAAADVAPAGDVAEATASVRQLQVGDQQILVSDPAMVQVFELVARLARSDLPVLVYGETGVGKENIARAIHHQSARASGPLVTVNCAALPDTLAESELFGHEKGAFSGAAAAKPGLLETADGGTIFLDEVGELSLPVQAKLLRVLEAKVLTRVGSTRERAVDIRIVSATNRNLKDEAAQGRFRSDLYFRLCGAAIAIPPLRDRPRELAVLAQTFLDRACGLGNRPLMGISAAAMSALARHRWPGNVRELKHTMEYVAVAVHEGTLEVWHLPIEIAGDPVEPAAATESTPTGEAMRTQFRRLADEVEELERTRMRQALAASGGVKTRAAQLLGMPVRTFTWKLRQYGLRGG
jgi:DNA-binding NtrC family response regulator